MSGNVVGWVFDHYPVHGVRDRTLKTVLSEIAEAANRDFENAHPGIRSICEHWGFSRSTVIEALTDLVADGWLEITERGGGRGKATVYRVCRERNQRLETVRESDCLRTQTVQKRDPSSTETVQIPDSTPSFSPSKENTPAATPAPPDDQQVFDAWVESTKRTARTVFSDERKRLIRKALKDYPLHDVLDAVRGWKRSTFNTGDNPEGRIYNDIELLLRDAAHIERFRDLARGTIQHGGGRTRQAREPDWNDGSWIK